MKYSQIRNNTAIYFVLILLSLVMVFQFYFRIFSLNTNIADLGFFISNSFSTINQIERVAYTHFQPFLYLFSFIKSLVRTEIYLHIILLLDFVILLFSSFAIKERYGSVAALIFIFYTPVWIIITYDFHLDILLIPLSIIYYKSLENNNIKLLLFSTLLIALVKEPYILLAITGILYFLHYNKFLISKSKIIFLLTIAALYFTFFLFILTILIPKISNGTFSGLSGDGFNYLTKLFDSYQTFSIDFINLFISKSKNFLVLFGSLFFLPILRPVTLFPIAPILALSLISVSISQSSYFSHYNSAVIITLLFSTFTSSIYQDIKNIKYVVLILTVAVNIFMGPIPLGRFFTTDKIYEFNKFRYFLSDDSSKNIVAMNELIPPDPEVSVSVQNNLNNINIASRYNYWLFPAGVESPHITLNPDVGIPLSERFNHNIKFLNADYAVIDSDIPYFYLDKGCSWINGKCTDRKVTDQYINSINYLKNNYVLLYKNNGFMIFKRK